jgi:hypothetical protein
MFWNLLSEFGIKNIQKFWGSNVIIRIMDRTFVKIMGQNTYKMEGYKLFITPDRPIGLGTQSLRRTQEEFISEGRWIEFTEF